MKNLSLLMWVCLMYNDIIEVDGVNETFLKQNYAGGMDGWMDGRNGEEMTGEMS